MKKKLLLGFLTVAIIGIAVHFANRFCKESEIAKKIEEFESEEDRESYINSLSAEERSEYMRYLLSNTESDLKPVLYLYPEEQTDIDVSVILHDKSFSCIYPSFNNGDSWKVTAFPNGDLMIDDKTYNYLYWETATKGYDFKPEYCIRGTEIAEFLEEKLLELGLTEHEANEFIVFWLPKMQNNEYNLISFGISEYELGTELKITPQPDTLIRIFISWKPSDKFVEVTAPEVITPLRLGFTAVEWGGCKVD